MSQSNVPSENNLSKKHSRGFVIVLAVIAVLVIGFLGLVYSGNGPSATGVVTKQQQFVTNVQEVYSTQTITLTTTPVTTAATTSIAALPITSSGSGSGSYPPPYLQYQTCQFNCFYPNPTYNSLCQSTGANSTVQCSGYIYHDTSGCVELAIPFVDPYYMDSVGYQYYTLRNLPSFAPSGWVTVTGHLFQGFNPSPSFWLENVLCKRTGPLYSVELHLGWGADS